MFKFLLLTDSSANPRSFPKQDSVSLEQTYPYKLREKYSDSVFWQLSAGNLETDRIFSQAIGYLSEWNPDYIIVQAGLADCRPEAFTDFEKILMDRYLSRLFPKIKLYLYDSRIIKRRQIIRTPKDKFIKLVKKLHFVFSNSKIIWIEIIAKNTYENVRPGVMCKIHEYNKILKHEKRIHYLEIKTEMEKIKGMNSDGIHINKYGHQLIFERLMQYIDE